MDRLIVREGQAREQTRCSLVGRRDHLVLARLLVTDKSTTNSARDQYQQVAAGWNFGLGPRNWPTFTRLVPRSGGVGTVVGSEEAVLAASPQLDWSVESISAGELTDKRTFVTRYSTAMFPSGRAVDPHSFFWRSRSCCFSQCRIRIQLFFNCKCRSSLNTL